MTTVADVLAYIEDIAPSTMAEDWDNVGLLCGRRDKQVKKILVALDPFRSVIEEAVREGADLLVTHHPLIFGEPLKEVNDTTETGRCLLLLMENGISAINAHTNLDLSPDGINAALADALGLENAELIRAVGIDNKNRLFGLLRWGTVPEQSLEDFLTHVKTALHCDGLRYTAGSGKVRKVAVGGGSCADEMDEVLMAGCDTFITADVKYNRFRTAYEKGLNLIDAGHFHTENPAMPLLAEKLAKQFPDVTVKFCENHTDCMKFF